MINKIYDLKELSIVILAKMTFIKQPTCYKYGKYESKSMPGAYFAEKISTPDKNVYNFVTKNKYCDDNPQDNLRKGAQYVIKAYDAGVVFALPITLTGESKMSNTQLRKIEKAWKQQGCINFDDIAEANKNQLDKKEVE